MSDMSSWVSKIPMDTVKAIAAKFSLDYRLVTAIIMQESGGKSFAMRHEPRYKYLFSPDKLAKTVGCTMETMVVMQMTSWGLMQVMGAVAYEDGFPTTQYVSQLVIPTIGIEYGCKRLSRLWGKYKTIDQVISAYNAGSLSMTPDGKYKNQAYVDSVLRYMVEVT